MMMNPSSFNALVIRINLVIVAFIVLACVIRVHRLPSSHEEKIDISLQCIHDDCLQKVVARLEDFGEDEGPNFLNELKKDTRFGLVNMGLNEELDWRSIGLATTISFDRVPEELKWDDLFPEWIDEERTPTCPEIPMPEFSMYEEVDVVAARFPCRRPEKGWKRDVKRLQVQLVAAEVAVRKAARDEKGRVRMVFVDECRPMMEVFKSEELERREGDWWMYRVNVERLEQKVALPVGSCMLALPSSQQGTGENQKKNSKLAAPGNHHRREAYATVLHSSDVYLCGAITLGQSLLKTGTDRDLLLLHDDSIPSSALRALSAAGWRLLPITRIRNPHATKNSYNEYNYSKLRLWQLTDYHKLVFVDADILVLRNLDHLFRLPELSAAGNDRDVFNSGVIVIEPSNHTFDVLMELAGEVVPYNGGDQGLLNEAYVWWHRLPRRVNFLKNVWSNKTEEAAAKDGLYAAEPPELHAIHYLGLKPWLCFRDYDCNWNIEDQRVYASDAAHWRWWKAHDEMEMGLRRWCGLKRRREEQLRKELRRAKEAGFRDGHWRLRISDRRRRVFHK